MEVLEITVGAQPTPCCCVNPLEGRVAANTEKRGMSDGRDNGLWYYGGMGGLAIDGRTEYIAQK